MYKSCSWHRSVTVNQRNSKKEEMPNESWNYGDRKKMSKNKIRRLTVYARVCVCGNWYCTIIRIWSNCVGKLIWPTSLFFCNNCKCNCLFTVCWNYGDCQLLLRLLLTCWNLVLPEQGWTNCSMLYFRHTPRGGPLQHLAGCLQPEQIQVLSLRIPHQHGSQWCCSQPRMSLCLFVCLPLSVFLTVLIK